MKSNIPVIFLLTALTACSLGVLPELGAPRFTEPPASPQSMSGSATAGISSQCLGSMQPLPQGISGRLLLSGNGAARGESLPISQYASHILMPNSGNTIPIPQAGAEQVERFSVSPDRTQFAYLLQERDYLWNGRLVIVSNNGELIFEKEYKQKGWSGLIGWLDKSRLLITGLPQDPPFRDRVYPPFPVVVFDVMSGEDEQLLPDYPDIRSDINGIQYWGEYGSVETVYSPDLQLVAYSKATLNSAINSIVLWDIKNGERIAEVTDHNGPNNAPLWLSDGREFILAVTLQDNAAHEERDELIIVDKNGQIRQLTHFGDLDKSVRIIRYSESADVHSIAFWLSVDDSPFYLSVYNRLNQEVKTYCVKLADAIYPPVWSPDGHQLLVAGWFDNMDSYGTVLVDLDSDLLAMVEKFFIPAGWLIDP